MSAKPPRSAVGRSAFWIEWFYRLSLLAKGALGLSQLLGGLGLLIAPSGAARRFVEWMARNEIAEDPADPLARAVIDWAAGLTQSSENFYTLYLLGHGALNTGVVLALLLRLRGAYHISLAVLMAFVAYQVTLYLRAPDPMILLLTAIDIAVIALVIAERRLGAQHEE